MLHAVHIIMRCVCGVCGVWGVCRACCMCGEGGMFGVLSNGGAGCPTQH